MKLIDDWRAQLNKLWSVRGLIYASLLGSADQILLAVNGTGILPPWFYLVAMVVVGVLRFIDQNAATPTQPG